MYSKIAWFCVALLMLINANYAQRTYFSGGYYYSVFMCNNQQLYTWGDNYYEQLARSDHACEYKKPCVATIPFQIISVDAGLGTIAAALTAEKQVITWGSNSYGELGTGETCQQICSRATPQKVSGGATGTEFLSSVQSISVGQSQVYALLESGEVVAWGNNYFGQLGDGTFINRTEPVYVKTSEHERLSNIIMLAAGGHHTYALTQDGYVYAWGRNNSNQLGYESSAPSVYAQKVFNKSGTPVSGIISVKAGFDFGLLLRNSSMLMGVGAYKGNNYGPQGKIYSTFPYADLVPGGETPNYYLENVVSMSAGFNHAVAIIKENSKYYVVAWGNNSFGAVEEARGGQIGVGYSPQLQYFSPCYVLQKEGERLHGATDVQAGCGVTYIQAFDSETNKNQFWVCGANDYGQLGTNDLEDRYFATRIDQFLCNPYCSRISFPLQQTFCQPFEEVLQTQLSPLTHSFKWYKDYKLLAHTADSLIVTDTGHYSVQVLFNEQECDNYTIETTIGSKTKNFDILNTSFCGDTIHFKIVGEGNFNWYTQKNTSIVGQQKSLAISSNITEHIIADSIVQVWVEHIGECQKMPVQSIKKCNCTAPPPILNDTSICYNKHYTLSAQGADSIVWHSDAELKKPLALSQKREFFDMDTGTYIYYLTNIANACESAASQVSIQLLPCAPWYKVQGHVFADNIPVPLAQVYAYSTDSLILQDSALTNEYGEFSLLLQNNEILIQALSPLPHYSNTWAGNTANSSSAHRFITDAHIKGIEIQLITTLSDIHHQKITTEKIIKIDVYDLNGRKLTSLSAWDKIPNLPAQQYVLLLWYEHTKIPYAIPYNSRK